MAAPYSMDLRERVAKAWDESGDADEIAATFQVSRAWVHRLIQRRRETGRGAAGGAHHRATRRDVGRTAGGPADDGGAQHAVAGNRPLGIDRQKKRYTPTNSVALMSRPPDASGARRCHSAMRDSMSSSTNRA